MVEIERDKGYKIVAKIKGHGQDKETTGHPIEIVDDYIIVHDTVTGEHKKICTKDIKDKNKDIEEVATLKVKVSPYKNSGILYGISVQTPSPIESEKPTKGKP